MYDWQSFHWELDWKRIVIHSVMLWIGLVWFVLFCFALFWFVLLAKRTGSMYWPVLPLLNHFLSGCKGPCEHLGKAPECTSWTLVTWLDIESHLASTWLPSPLLLAAHQYKWLEILCFQSARTAHDFFLASASIFLEMSGLKFWKIKSNQNFWT